MANKFPRGSEWRKWDLQIHVPGAKHADQYTKKDDADDWDQFIQSLKDSDVSAFGVTDYFSIEGYETLLTKINGVPELENKKFFPCVELRLDISVNSDIEQLQCHLLFDDQYDLNKIKNFLAHLPLKNKKTNGSVAYCTDTDITDCGGYDKVSVTKEGLEESLKQSFGNERPFLIAGIASGMGSNRAANANIKKELSDLFDDFCDLFFGNETNADYYMNEDRYENGHKKAKPKPIVSTSDCHTFDDCQNKSGKKFSVLNQNGSDLERYGFSWIKADTTFEGLKQILWEPKERVRIQERNPADSKPGRIIIDSVTYKDVSGQEKTVVFNRDLNSIIGIRGSGKSTLLKNIAFNIEPVQFSERGDNEDRLYKLDSFKVLWGDGQEDGGGDDSPKSVFYIPQNYLSMLAYDESGKSQERDEFLTDLLKKNSKFANAIRAYTDYVSDNKVKIEGLIEELLKSDQLLKEARKQLKKQGSRKEIETEITSKNAEIKKYQQSKTSDALTDDEVKSYTEAKQAVTDNTKTVSILQQDKDILTGLLQSGTQVMSIASQEIARLSTVRQTTLKNELLKKSKENLEQLISAEIKNIDTEITKLNQVITEKQKIIDQLTAKIRANKALETLTKELGQLQQTLKAIGELEAVVTQSEQNKEASITGLVSAYSDYDTKQQAIFGTIKFEEDFDFLQIDIVTYYNTADLERFVRNNINTVSTSPNLNIDGQDLKILFGDSPTKPTADTVRKFITKLIDEDIILKVEAGEIGQVISAFLKDRFEIDFLNSVKTKGDEVLFKNMTGGQKAIAMLELVFSFDDERYPILIDQPEDDLDVVGVATDLVRFIKQEKEERQIIIVSHNASLVVCADTEEVLVSECHRQQHGKYDFTYQTGAIEDPEIRDQIIKVLEGGKAALKQRARKLNFKHEI